MDKILGMFQRIYEHGVIGRGVRSFRPLELDWITRYPQVHMMF